MSDRHIKAARSFRSCARRQAIFLAVGLLLTGCVGVLPFPYCSNKPSHGIKLKSKDTAFIRRGTTSVSEILDTLGTNGLYAPRLRAMAFSWELPGGRGIWWIAHTEGGTAGEFEWSRWRAFFVAFDTNDLVMATDTVHLSGRKDLCMQLEAWAQKHRAAPGRIHPDRIIAKDPSPRVGVGSAESAMKPVSSIQRP